MIMTLMARITALRIKLSGENVDYYISLMNLGTNKPNENIIAAFTLLKDGRPTVKSKIFSYAVEHYPHLNKTIVEYLEIVGILMDDVRRERVMRRFAELGQSSEVEQYKSKLEKVKEGATKDYSKIIPGFENEFKDNFEYIIYALKEADRDDAKEILENLYENADLDSEYRVDDFLRYGLGMSSDEIKELQNRRSARKIKNDLEISNTGEMTDEEYAIYRDAYDPGYYGQWKARHH
jgi:hypothetical protein